MLFFGPKSMTICTKVIQKEQLFALEIVQNQGRIKGGGEIQRGGGGGAGGDLGGVEQV